MIKIKIGVMIEPPPTPEMPTSVPTIKPAATKAAIVIYLRPCFVGGSRTLAR